MLQALKKKRNRCILGHEASPEENLPGPFFSLNSCQPSFSIVVYSNTGSFLFLSSIVDITLMYNRVTWQQEMDDQSKDFEEWQNLMSNFREFPFTLQQFPRKQLELVVHPRPPSSTIILIVLNKILDIKKGSRVQTCEFSCEVISPPVWYLCGLRIVLFLSC